MQWLPGRLQSDCADEPHSYSGLYCPRLAWIPGWGLPAGWCGPQNIGSQCFVTLRLHPSLKPAVFLRCNLKVGICHCDPQASPVPSLFGLRGLLGSIHLRKPTPQHALAFTNPCRINSNPPWPTICSVYRIAVQVSEIVSVAYFSRFGSRALYVFLTRKEKGRD